MFYFYPVRLTSEAGSTAGIGFQASSADNMKGGGPEHHPCSERFYGAIRRKCWHGNFPLKTKTMVTPGQRERSSLVLLSLTAQRYACRRIYVAKPHKLLGALVISRPLDSRAPTPLTLVVSFS